MSFSRRAFVKTLGIGGAAALSSSYIPRAYDLPSFWTPTLLAQEGPLLLHNNENPLGPGDKVLNAIREHIAPDGAPVGRYPFALTAGLAQAIAQRFDVEPANIIMGTGSTQALRTAVQVYTSSTKPLVTATPTYEECTQYAQLLGSAVVEVGLNDNLELDLDEMAAAARGAGMVFLNNPNNPTATVHPEDAVNGFIDNVLTASPDTKILVDEAYHDYVTDPRHVSQISHAVRNPNVMAARTFSKAHGMAGMRVGYMIAHEDAVREMRPWHSGNTLNTPGVIGGTISILDTGRLEEEAARNTAARQYTIDWFKNAGFDATDSQCNFIFVKTGMNAQEFRDGARENGVFVGRNFPPYQEEWARISIGTLEQMQRATEVFAKVLRVNATAAAA
jgi:histidinol-phosphate aminotransferase